ncbi:putative peptidyl-trna hydrolase domain protein [Eutypa lata UCREL1]|uniref:Putative peptidyl-trna hydrolase domain protein n=1 Tax=Eutypa lata (strain UCR-EL1) TaxID=1287681 RepID=M7S6I1_EUTLA|nr:putative peptidyl-trna hydrolase domain protein [Eutypa lata UCREL1]
MLSSSSLRRSLTVLRNDIATAPIRIRPLLTHTTTIPSTSQCSPSRLRPFSSISCLQKHHNLPPRPKPPPDSEIEESFLKGSGPGGQKINKTNSAVQLKHVPTGIVVKCQATRSRSQNRTIARELLAARVDDLARGDESRSAVVGAFHRKRKASKAKKSRRKYRKLLAAEGEEGGEKRREGEDGLEENLSLTADSNAMRPIF